MFKNDNNSDSETLIGPSVHVKGDFKSQGNVQIEGQVTGSIQTAGNLRIGKNSKITANISAANAIISGTIKGNVMVSERLELAPTARIDGDVTTKILIMAEGAQLNGRCQMSNLTAANEASKQKKTLLESPVVAAK